jgi:hypothetical protein
MVSNKPLAIITTTPIPLEVIAKLEARGHQVFPMADITTSLPVVVTGSNVFRMPGSWWNDELLVKMTIRGMQNHAYPDDGRVKGTGSAKRKGRKRGQ